MTKAEMASAGGPLKVTLMKSPIGCPKRHRATLQNLGLRRRHQTVEWEATPSVVGMIDRVRYLLTVEKA